MNRQTYQVIFSYVGDNNNVVYTTDVSATSHREAEQKVIDNNEFLIRILSCSQYPVVSL